MTVCAIMQPTYLPWVGYFDLMDQADVFVFLDNAQYSRRSWQQRNRIRSPGGLEWLTVPVKKSGRGQAIRDVEIQVGAFPQIHIEKLERGYRNAPYFPTHALELNRILTTSAEHRSLSRLNREAIEWMAERLQLESPTMLGSELGANGRRSELLVAICRAVGAKTYLTPPGSVDYLVEDRTVFAEAGLPVLVQHYEHPSWPQLHEPFVPFASAVDLLFNAAPDASAIVRSGRREPVPLDSWEASS